MDKSKLGVCVFAISLLAAGWVYGYSGGDGTAGDPYQISNEADIQELSADPNNYDKHFILTNDIILRKSFSVSVIAPIYDGQNDPNFTGVFNGAGFAIRNLYINAEETGNDNIGFFGRIGPQGVVLNLGLTGMTFYDPYAEEYDVGYFGLDSGDNSENVGGMCGTNQGTISNCYVKCYVRVKNVPGQLFQSKYIGGLCGLNEGVISNSHSIFNISSEIEFYYVGGLCGSNSGFIANSYATGIVTPAQRSTRVGGFCGLNSYGIIYGSYADAEIECSEVGDVSCVTVGGLCGENEYGVLRDCYAKGSISGGNVLWFGGLCGLSQDSEISNCFAAVSFNVTGEYLPSGGFCAENFLGPVNQSFWDMDVSGFAYSAGGCPVSTEDMMKAATYVGWDDGMWVIDEGNDYPHLVWENTPGVPIFTDYPARIYAGNGVDEPFEIDSLEDFICMSKRLIDWDKNFVLTSNVDMSSVDDYTPPTDFTGTFDGQGFYIENLIIDANGFGSTSQLGLFGRVGDEGEIRNLNLQNYDLVGGIRSLAIGGLCGTNCGTLFNCNVSGNIDGSWHTGLLCGNNDGVITNCGSEGILKGITGVGGLCGLNLEGGKITNSQAVTETIAYDKVGGFCGENLGQISKCRTDGEIYESFNDSDRMYNYGRHGGFCGINEGIIGNCYSIADVISYDNYEYSDSFGGFVGINAEGEIFNCYSIGIVGIAELCGGFCAYSYAESTVENCYWDIETSGVSSSVYDPGIGLTTDEMFNLDFQDGWVTRAGFDYPILDWEETLSGDVAGDFSVDLMDFYYLSNAWLSSSGNVNYIEELNLDNTGDSAAVIDVADLAVFCENWLKGR